MKRVVTVTADDGRGYRVDIRAVIEADIGKLATHEMGNWRQAVTENLMESLRVLPYSGFMLPHIRAL